MKMKFGLPTQGGPADAVINSTSDVRAEFITKTYLHLTGAVIAFACILVAMFQVIPHPEDLVRGMTRGYNWLLVLGAFMVVSTVANRWAQSATSVPVQYLGLGVYVLVQAVISFPLVYLAARVGGPGVLETAAVMTGVLFVGMSAIVFWTREDFSFLGGALGIAGIAALGLIVCSIFFGFNLGVIFTVAMIAFSCAYILYYTSGVLYHYRPGQHVAASLALFAAVALLFWYVLELVMQMQRR